MRRTSRTREFADSFEIVRKVGLTMPEVEATTRYDGSPVLKIANSFVAGLAMHRSAEPASIVVRVSLEDREWLLEEAPETYYVTDYYRPYPVVLVRLSGMGEGALSDLLKVSRSLALEKARPRKRRQPCS